MTALFPRIDKPAALEAEALSMSRGGTELFQGVSAHINPGDVMWIKGDNGIGKTTLLEAFAGLSRPETGVLKWKLNNTNVSANHVVAYQPHRSFAKAALTTKEDLSFWARLYGTSKNVEAALGVVGLSERQNVPSWGLSAGQHKRLSLAKLILSQKPIWLMDEPDAAMDKAGVVLIDRFIQQQLKRGGSVIMASHNAPRRLGDNTRSLTLTGAS